MSRLASKRMIFDAANLAPEQRKGARVKTRWIKFKHVDEEIPIHTIIFADGTEGPSFVEFTDGLIDWKEFRAALDH